jgi:hypothetical protein
VCQSKIKKFICFIFAIFLTCIKFFTAEIRYSDDPTVRLVAKFTPSTNNNIILSGGELNDVAFQIVADENSYTGSGFYSLIVSGGWLLFWLVIGVYYLFDLRGKTIR